MSLWSYIADFSPPHNVPKCLPALVVVETRPKVLTPRHACVTSRVWTVTSSPWYRKMSRMSRAAVLTEGSVYPAEYDLRCVSIWVLHCVLLLLSWRFPRFAILKALIVRLFWFKDASEPTGRNLFYMSVINAEYLHINLVTF